MIRTILNALSRLHPILKFCALDIGETPLYLSKTIRDSSVPLAPAVDISTISELINVVLLPK
jgi:hypothetical protein